MNWLIPPAPPVAMQVLGESTQFPLTRIFCVGRNYAAHAQEMGQTERADPFFFMKPAHAYTPLSAEHAVDWPYPSKTSDLHHEVELVVALKQGGQNLSPEQARACVAGYAIGIDMTRRDLQAQAKQKSHPWEAAKAFDHSAPIGPIQRIEQTGWLDHGAITLLVNGEVRQQGDLNQMLWPVDQAIAYLSTLFTLMPGDILMTGTPSGVGAIQKGDQLEACIEGLESVSLALS